MSSNPYQSPCHVAGHRRSFNWFNWSGFAAVLPALYPLVLVGSVYGAWVMAWIALGHPPRAWRDDPWNIAAAVNAAYMFSMVIILGLPLGAGGSIFAHLLLMIRWRWPARIAATILVMAVWVSMYLLLQWDPLEVVKWYMD